MFRRSGAVIGEAFINSPKLEFPGLRDVLKRYQAAAPGLGVDLIGYTYVPFGYGAHLCLGQHLAKMEMRILWEEMIPRLQSVELAGEPANSQAVFVNGPKRLPIRFKMA